MTWTIDKLLARAVPIPFCGCWIWDGACKGRDEAYPAVRVGKIVWRGHRLMLSLKIGRELQPAELACHECDVPLCIAPNHLFLGTPLSNMRDMIEKGRARPPRGEMHWASKLTEEQIAEIKLLHKAGTTQTALGALFGVTQQTIGNIINHKTWRHL